MVSSTMNVQNTSSKTALAETSSYLDAVCDVH